MSCIRVTLDNGRKVCLSVPGNAKVLTETTAGTLRPPADYTDAEIRRGLTHGGHRHPEKTAKGRQGAGQTLLGRR